MATVSDSRSGHAFSHRWRRGVTCLIATGALVSGGLAVSAPAQAATAPPPPASAPSGSSYGLSAGLTALLRSAASGANGVSPSDLLSSILKSSGIWGDAASDRAATDPSGNYSSASDPGSLYTIENAIGARSVWAQQDSSRRQITGQGVGVAVLDSGVRNVAGLDGAGKVVDGPDLSIEGNGLFNDADTFGHGTHLAGIIGAHDPADLSAAGLKKLSPSTQLGVAPDSTIEALKLADTDGSTDVSQIIAALNWVTEHQTLPNGNKIRVVNLSFGTDSTQAYQSDPLAAAAENAWKHGLVVVVSGGNEGPDAHRLTDPAMDPYVLSVGASAPSNGTVNGWSNPQVASFSSSGTTDRHVDVLAPGKSVASLRDPGSFVDTLHPEGRVAADTTGRLFRGSGTSQAAAVVSGTVALLLQAAPNLTPDEIKAVLMRSATPVQGGPALAGAGQINVSAALSLARQASALGSFAANAARQTWPSSNGSGSIEAARGGDDLVDADGNTLTGEIDVQGNPWNAAQWWAAASAGRSWNGGSWNGAVWTGAGWDPNGSAYASARWASARWASARWADANWDSAQWSAAVWESARWASARWASARWASQTWN